MAFVQSVRTAGSAVTSLTSPSMTTTSGNVLVTGAAWGSGGTGNISGFSDSYSNASWDASTVSSDAFFGQLRSKQNVTGGTGHTVTYTFTTSDYPTIQFAEYSGRDTSSSYRDQTVYQQINTTGGPASYTGPSFNPSVAGVDAFVFASTNLGGGTLSNTGTNGWTALANSGTGGTGDNGDANAYYASFALYKSNLSTGAQNPTATLGNAWSSNVAATFVITFKAASGGGGGSGPPAPCGAYARVIRRRSN